MENKHSNNTIHSLEDIYQYRTQKVLVLYSGGVDGTYLLLKLFNSGFKHVYALTIDIGGDIEKNDITNIVNSFGYTSLIIDKRDEFTMNYLSKAIFSKALFLNGYPISASLSRPLKAYTAVEIAKSLEIKIIIHTSNNSQNSMRRFNNSFKLLQFKGVYGSPFEYSSVSRKEKLRELAENKKFYNFKSYSSDINIWCREFESGEFDNPENINIDAEMYLWTRVIENKAPISISIGYVNGLPVTVNDAEMKLIDIISYLNKALGVYGIGRFIGLEEISNGQKVLEIREAPAAHLLIDGFRHLETAILKNDSIFNKMHMEQIWIRECSEGRWFDELKCAAEAFVSALAQRISGTVTYNVHYYSCQITSIKAINPIYILDRNKLDGINTTF